MVLMYSCCSYFSIRFGIISTGLFSLLQNTVLILISWTFLSKGEQLKSDILNLLNEYNFLYVHDILFSLAENSNFYLYAIISYCSVHSVVSLILIYSSFTYRKIGLIPWMLIEVTRIAVLVATHVSGMMILKENIQDLGLLIGATLAGSFYLMYLVYLWLCVLSLYQALKIKRDNTFTKRIKVRSPLSETPSNTSLGTSKRDLMRITHRNPSTVTSFYRNKRINNNNYYYKSVTIPTY